MAEFFQQHGAEILSKVSNISIFQQLHWSSGIAVAVRFKVFF